MTSHLNLTCFESFPELKTKRLTLRSIQPQDAEQIFQMRSNQATNRYILRNQMTDAESAKELVANVNQGYQDKQALAFAGLLRDKKEIIGTCGFNRFDMMNNRAEIGGELFVKVIRLAFYRVIRVTLRVVGRVIRVILIVLG